MFMPLPLPLYFQLPFDFIISVQVSQLKRRVPMWALRRASFLLRSPGFIVGTSRACCVKLTPTTCVKYDACIYESPQITCSRFVSLKTIYHAGHSSLQVFIRRELSSLVSRSNKEGDDEDELQNEHELSELFKEITSAPGLSVHYALEKWVKEGKEPSKPEISWAMDDLCRHQMYETALQLSEWREANNKQIDFPKTHYLRQLGLIARVRGLEKAKEYIESIPKSFRKAVYQCLLDNCVRQNNLKVAEEIFNKMKSLGLPITAFSCNKMLLLYKWNDKRKIGDFLSLMERENVWPSHKTFKILIDSSKDIAGMEKIVEKMESAGIVPDTKVQGLLARNYISAGLREKAEAVLKKMEGEQLEENRSVCRFLLTHYADLGMVDEVARVWKVCESKPLIKEYVVAIEAWGKLKKIEEAEAIFEMMLNKLGKQSSRPYEALLKVYADNKMVMKGMDLVKRMADSGSPIGPVILDSLVNLYVQAGEVESGEFALQRAIQKKQMKPKRSTYMAILDEYARRGDVHNSEKIFLRMRQAGFTCRPRCFQALIQAYVNAKLPAYGIRERMKDYNIFPNKALAALLAQADAFRNTAVSDSPD